MQRDVVGPRGRRSRRRGRSAGAPPSARASMFAGDMFLPAGVDDQLLLAVDDLHVAVVVDLGDVAGVQPAVGVDRLARSSRGRCGSRASRSRRARAARRPRRASARRPAAAVPQVPMRMRAGRVDRRAPDELGHPPQLADRQPERLEVVEHLDRRRRRAAAEPARPGRARAAPGSPRLRLLASAPPGRSTPWPRARLELLPDARDRAPRGRPHLRQLQDHRRAGRRSR